MLKVRGYAAWFGNLDKDNEVLVKGAFSPWLARNPTTSVKIFWVHGHRFNPMKMPVGVSTLLRQDAKGLYFEGEILDTIEGFDLQKLVRGGAVREASFGFRTRNRYQKKGIWHLAETDLLEISAANWGVNDRAYIEPIPGQEETSNANEERTAELG